MFDRVDAQFKFATGEVVDKGVAKHIAGGVGEVADGKGFDRTALILGQERLIPEIAEPGVGAVVNAGVLHAGVDHLLAGHDVGVGVGAEDTGVILGGVTLQRRQDRRLDRVFTDHAEDLPRAIINAVDGDFAIVQCILQGNVAEKDMGRRFPGQGTIGQNQVDEQDGQQGRDQGLVPCASAGSIAV